jgi:hypothetical protein
MDTAAIVEDVLTHFGVRGMRWGVRRKATVGPTEVIVSDKRKKIKTSGGEGRPASRDAVRVRTSGQIAKKSGYKALSDKELQDYTKRLNLEQQAKRLTYADSSPAKKFVLSLLGQTGKNVASDVGNQVASHQVKKHLGGRMVKAGLVAA